MRLTTLPLIAGVTLCLAGCGGGSSSSSAASPPPSESQLIAADQVGAQAKMKATLRDPDSAKFRDVHAYALNIGDAKGYIFCGKVNSKNGFGGYSGYQRFVASEAMVGTEEQVRDFGIVWAKLCPPENDRGPVAF